MVDANYPSEWDEEFRKRARELLEGFGRVSAEDTGGALVDSVDRAEVERRLTELMPMSPKLCAPGEEKVMRDGTRYVVASDGSWRKKPSE